MEYVIYCRKSTDESSGMQTQSIPDQIKRCVEYARNNNLSIAEKPEDFSMFESDSDLIKEDNDIDNKELYQETRGLFIIKEQESAKIPYIRRKRRNLINLIGKRKIQGLLCYSPDRQARNIVEGGELINFVDEELIDLKYTNFHFEPNASGKMMLGIRFIFSKQYSDKLSEDITRGNRSRREQGKLLGQKKYGYIKNDEGYLVPDGENFEILKEAFQLKLNTNKSNREIAEIMNAKGFTRNKGLKADYKKLGYVFKDHFYYGMNITDTESYDLRDKSPYYKAVISEEEFYKLQTKLQQTVKIKKPIDEIPNYYPLSPGFMRSVDGDSFSCYYPNKSRFDKKLDKIREANPSKNIELEDIIQPNQIHFKVSNTKSEYHNVDITFDKIQKIILEKFKQATRNEEAYKEYLNYMKTQIDLINEEKRTEANKIQLIINKKATERINYIKTMMGKDLDDEETIIYNEQKKRLNKEIAILKQQREDNDTSERNEILEIEVFFKVIENIGKYYEVANYVQQRKICDLVVSNIFFDKEKGLHIAVKPDIEDLLFSLSEDDGNRTRVGKT